MFHLAGFYGSIAASQTNIILPACQDGAFTLQNQRLIMPQRMQIRRTYLMGSGITEGRIVVPSMRTITYPRIHPVDKSAAPANDPAIVRLDDRGPTMLQTEGLGLEITTDATAGPLTAIGLLWLYPGYREAISGQCYTLKATASVAGAVGVWQAGSMTLENDLPAGEYELIGADARGTNLAALRFRFPGQPLLPGIVCEQAAGEFLTDHQRMGNMGSFGRFTNTQVPTIEVLGLGATTTQDIYLDLIKVG